MKDELDNIKEIEKQNKSLIGVRYGFSERYGLSELNSEIQIINFDERTRICIFNRLYSIFKMFADKREIAFNNKHFINNFDYIFNEYFYKDILNKFVDEIPLNCKWNEPFTIYLKDIVQNAPYNEVLDLIESISNFLENYLIERLKNIVFKKLNELFKKENIGYSFIDGIITPITNEFEIIEIQSAVNNPFENCKIQIQKSLKLFSDRKNKDYKNCIKEAISAVEALCKNIPGGKNSKLSDILKSFEKKKIYIHPVLKEAIAKLYAYTSDEGGLRHAEKPEISNVTEEEAKFILIICSSIINYLTSVFKESKII